MSTGVLWQTLFQGDENNVRKVLFGSWLWRDWDYENTSLTGATFFASDGNLSDTLFSPDNPGGPWFDAGYIDQKGPQFNQKLDNKKTQPMQSRWPIRWDYTGQSEEIHATLLEDNPVVDALRDNRALGSLPSVGAIGYSTSEPVNRDLFWRQCLFIGVDGRSGENYYIIRVYPKVLIVDFGVTPWNIDDVAGTPVHCQAIPDDFSVSPTGDVGAPRWILRDGPGWRAQGGPTQWALDQTAPVATALSGLKASITFDDPVSPNSPFTYTVTQTTGGVSSTATIVSTVDNGETTTITVGDLTASDTYTFTVTPTGSNGVVGVPSLASNTITATST